MNKTDLALIQEIYELDEAKKEKLLEYARALKSEQHDKSYYVGLWLEAAEELNAKIRAQYGDNHYFNTQATLDELRDEASEWPRRS